MTEPSASSGTPIPLFRRYPALAGRIAWRSFGHYPTPVERVELAGGRTLQVKRDDLTAPVYGGNKVRKLEFLIAHAAGQGARRLITAGALGSHHALATALYGREAGIPVTLLLFPQPVTPHVRRVLLTDVALGAELRFVPRMEMVPGALLARRWAARQERACVIPPGGSDALGTLGYVNAALELAEQVAAGELEPPSRVHVAAGTLGTTAGIAIGLALAGLDTEVAATRITGRIVTNERALLRLIRGALALLEPEVRLDAQAVAARVEIRHGQIGAGYGRETEAGRRATELLGAAGLKLDPTYTAKAAAEALAGAGDGRELFWQTLSAAEPPLPEEESELESRLPERFRRCLEA
ncbi:MAG TPA: pyridoxal-phosphate dependent enzyme [Longimicrobiales bacterium]